MIVVDDELRGHKDLVAQRARHCATAARSAAYDRSKRDLACEQARGELLRELGQQRLVRELAPQLPSSGSCSESGVAEVCGLDRLLYYDGRSDRAWRYAWPRGTRPWIADPTLFYTKDFWRRNPHPDTNMALDCRLFSYGGRKALVALEDEHFFVGIIHGTNTSPRRWTSHSGRSAPTGRSRHLLGKEQSSTGCSPPLAQAARGLTAVTAMRDRDPHDGLERGRVSADLVPLLRAEPRDRAACSCRPRLD